MRLHKQFDRAVQGRPTDRPTHPYASWMRLGCAVAAIVVAGAFAVTGPAPSAHAQGADPVKLAVEQVDPDGGGPAMASVTLLDAANAPVVAAKDYAIEIEVLPQPAPLSEAMSQAVTGETLAVTIAAGASSATFEVPAEDPGIYEVRARHPELLEGAGLVLVRDVARGDAETPPATPSPTATAAPGAPPGPPPETALPPVVRPPAPLLRFRYTPSIRPLLADGLDAATITAFLDEGVAAGDIRVRLHLTGGRLDPANLVIKAGDDFGAALLTSRTPQSVTVEYLGAVPAARLAPDESPRLAIPFVPPIVGVTVEAQPSNPTPLDPVEIVVRLVDQNGNPTATERDRTVTVGVTRGYGTLGAEQLILAAGQFEARTDYHPTWPGPVVIAANIDSVAPAVTEFTVRWPWLQLVLTMVFGLLGGGINAFRVQDPPPSRNQVIWQLVVGMVAGVVAYWILIFSLLGPVLGPTVVNNFLTVIVVALIGGWLGESVLTWVARRLGLFPG